MLSQTICNNSKMRIVTLLMCIVGVINTCNAQNNMNNDFESFRKEINEDFNDFRKEIMNEYIGFVRNPWKNSNSLPPVPKPKEEHIPPVVAPKEDSLRTLPNDNPIVIDNLIKSEPVTPKPEPISPITVIPTIETRVINIEYFGTKCSVRFPQESSYHIKSINENHIADALSELSSEKYDNLVYDCLKIREDLQLCDWAYLLFLERMSETVCGRETNEATLLMAFVYMQSGYKMRLAHDYKRIYMLFASKHTIFGKPSYNIEGDEYYGLVELPSQLAVSKAHFPKEKSLSLIIAQQPLFTVDRSDAKVVSSSKYADFRLSYDINKNLISFYSTYPSSYYNGDFMTRWAQYANTPIAPNIAETMYHEIREKLHGLTEEEAVNRLLNWVQTGFEYEYDDKVWGYDRTFFAEEVLYYPYCDCEDRSVLLSRIIRDVLKLKSILVYCPGHLFIAVKFNENVNGDFITVNGNKYVVCDPTYIGASVGCSMPEMSGKTASVILLE